MTVETMTDVAGLQAENARLRAIVDRVEALASGARLHWNAAPVDGTIAVVDTSGGWQNRPPTTWVYARADGGLNGASYEDGDWYCQWPDADERPISWGEVNRLDEPACDRPTVSIETYVPVEALDEALRGES